MPEVFVGRQPIYNRKLDVHGYELLFRHSPDAGEASFRDGDQATSQVILNTFLELGAEHVVGDRLAFVNLTRGFIVGEYPLPVPPESVVLEVLEDVVPDEEVVRGLERLAGKGFKIALDDYTRRDYVEPLMALADIVKVDCLALGRRGVERALDQLSGFRGQLLAEKVENYEEFEFYQDLGFDLYQGFFLSKPKIVRGRRVPANRLGILRLLARLHDPSVQFDELERLISGDVGLSYNLLRYVNSAMFSMPRKVEAVGETLIILGVEPVRSLVSLILLSGIDDKPGDLIVTSLLRARMCYLLGEALEVENPHSYFTVGLFSTLDAMLDTPLPVILRELPLADEIRGALLAKTGRAGEALRCVMAYEQGEWGAAHVSGLSASDVKAAFLDAVDWANKLDRDLGSTA